MVKTIVCEFSGGADSIYATILTKEKYIDSKVVGVFIDYGQICVNQEWNTAWGASNKLGIELKYIKIKDIWNDDIGMLKGETNEVLDVYTPCRNLAILGCVIAYSDSINADIIITGSKGLSKVSNDNYSYYDSTIAFYKLMEAVWNYTTENKRLHQIIPILAEGRTNKMTKEEVYRGLIKYGFDYNDTWSCFKGGISECGKCHNCKIKKDIFTKIQNDTTNNTTIEK